jgi:hypothetical protein
MITLAQASDDGTIGLVTMSAYITHRIWCFRSFGLFRVFRSFGKDNPVRNIARNNWLRYFLGVMGLTVPIVGIIHGFAIWARAGARVSD